MHRSAGVVQRTIPQNILAYPSAKAPHCPSSIKFAAEFETFPKRHEQVRRSRPAINTSAECPALTPVIPTNAACNFLPQKPLAPRNSRGVGRLPGLLAAAWLAFVFGFRGFPRNRLHYPSLNQQTRAVGDRHAMLDANLRSPAPEIARIGQRR